MYNGFYIYIYIWILTLFLSVDVGLTMLANATHIRSKGALHRKPDIEGEGWQRPCHSLLALSSWTKLYVNNYLVGWSTML
jgi:hypothetical protein